MSAALLQDVLAVCADRMLADLQASADVFVRKVLFNQAYDLDLARSEHFQVFPVYRMMKILSVKTASPKAVRHSLRDIGEADVTQVNHGMMQRPILEGVMTGNPAEHLNIVLLSIPDPKGDVKQEVL